MSLRKLGTRNEVRPSGPRLNDGFSAASASSFFAGIRGHPQARPPLTMLCSASRPKQLVGLGESADVNRLACVARAAAGCAISIANIAGEK